MYYIHALTEIVDILSLLEIIYHTTTLDEKLCILALNPYKKKLALHNSVLRIHYLKIFERTTLKSSYKN